MSGQPTEMTCNHDCDPQSRGVRSDGATHHFDCPVWVYLGVSEELLAKHRALMDADLEVAAALDAMRAWAPDGGEVR